MRATMTTGLVLGALLHTAAAADASRFEDQVRQQGERYGTAGNGAEAQQLFKEGRVSEVNARLRALVPDARKGAADYFVLANMFYRIDEPASYDYMRRAEALVPDEPSILLERGMHEHRRGDCRAALGYYERFHRSAAGADHPVSWAYRTHCHLRLGDAGKALAAWPKANFRDRHVAIEKGMYEIFGPPSPEVRREALYRQIRAGRRELLCDVIRHDTQWETDWWNVHERKHYLEYDRAFAAAELKAGSREHEWLQLCEQLPALDAAAVKARLERSGVWGKQRVLPPSPALSYLIVRRLTETKLASASDLMAAFEAQLRAKVDAQPGEPEWLDLLAYLYAATGKAGALQAVDELGWKQRRLEKYAASYVFGLDPAAPEFAPTLARAFAEFPNSKVLAKASLQQNWDTPGKGAAMALYVASEFAHVHDYYTGDGYRLGDYLASLAHELAGGAGGK